MTSKDIIKDIKANSLKPVYLLMGEEPFFIDQVANALEKHVIPESEKDFNQTIVFGSDADPQKILATAKSFPMMGEKTLLIVKEAQTLERKIQELAPYCENPSATTVLVLCYKYKKVDKRSALYKAIQRNGEVLISDKVRDYKMADWVAQHARSIKAQLTEKQCHLLSDYLGSDLSRVNNELKKLQTIAGDSPITDDLIEQHVGISKEFNIFELQKALLNRDFAKCVQITNYYNKNPKSMHIIPAIGAMYNVYTRLIKLFYLKDKSKQGAAAAGISAFFYRDYQSALQRYALKEVVQNISILKEFDLKAKGLGSSGNDSEGLFMEMTQRLLL